MRFCLVLPIERDRDRQAQPAVFRFGGAERDRSCARAAQRVVGLQGGGLRRECGLGVAGQRRGTRLTGTRDALEIGRGRGDRLLGRVGPCAIFGRRAGACGKRGPFVSPSLRGAGRSAGGSGRAPGARFARLRGGILAAEGGDSDEDEAHPSHRNEGTSRCCFRAHDR